MDLDTKNHLNDALDRMFSRLDRKHEIGEPVQMTLQDIGEIVDAIQAIIEALPTTA